MRGNEIRMILSDGRVSYPEGSVELYQYDYGQRLVLEGLNLPVAYEVHFSNDEHGESVTQIADSTGVDIPDMLLTTGQKIYVWVYLHNTENDGETVYKGIIPVKERALPKDTPPTPVQQSALDQAIAAFNAGIEEIPTDIQSALAEAKASGEFDGPPGPKGDSGDSGPQGPKGEVGPKGDAGEPGEPGVYYGTQEPTDPDIKVWINPNGDQSNILKVKSNGEWVDIPAIKGDTGAQGPKGDKGDPGETGAQGPKGEKGDTGDVGPQGVRGMKGDKGDRGYPGNTGPKGPKGDDGDPGPKGDKGDPGDPGVYYGTETPTDPDTMVWIDPDGSSSGFVSDVKVNGASVVNDGVANVPIASSSNVGVVKSENGYGIFVNNQTGRLYTDKATANQAKAGTDQFRPIVPYNQHESAFYGLAKAAGDITQISSSNPVGQYTPEAQTAIQKMIGAGPKYSNMEEIADITLAQDMDEIIVTTDKNGLPFKLAYAQITLVFGTGTAGINDYITANIIDNNGLSRGLPTLRLLPASFTWLVYNFLQIGGLAIGLGKATSTGNTQPPQLSTFHTNTESGGRGGCIAMPYITGVLFKKYTAETTPIIAGSRIVINGCRIIED